MSQRAKSLVSMILMSTNFLVGCKLLGLGPKNESKVKHDWSTDKALPKGPYRADARAALADLSTFMGFYDFLDQNQILPTSSPIHIWANEALGSLDRSMREAGAVGEDIPVPVALVLGNNVRNAATLSVDRCFKISVRPEKVVDGGSLKKGIVKLAHDEIVWRASKGSSFPVVGSCQVPSDEDFSEIRETRVLWTRSLSNGSAKKELT